MTTKQAQLPKGFIFFFPMVPLLDTCTYPIQQGFNNSGEQTNFLKIKVLEE